MATVLELPFIRAIKLKHANLVSMNNPSNDIEIKYTYSNPETEFIMYW